MKIKQDPISRLWCRGDGAVLMPPTGGHFKTFRWTFGCETPDGYRCVRYRGRFYYVHVLICRAYNGLPPEGKPEVDHINRCPSDNRPENLHWVSRKENNDNKDCVDQSVEKYGVRACEDKAAYYKAYNKAYNASHREERKAYNAAYCAAYHAKMKAQGLTWRKGPDGKWGWYPFKRA